MYIKTHITIALPKQNKRIIRSDATQAPTIPTSSVLRLEPMQINWIDVVRVRRCHTS